MSNTVRHHNQYQEGKSLLTNLPTQAFKSFTEKKTWEIAACTGKKFPIKIDGVSSVHS